MKPVRKYGGQYALDPYLQEYVRDETLDDHFRETTLASILKAVSKDIKNDKTYAFRLTEHRDTSYNGLVMVNLLLVLYEEDD